MFTPLGNLFGRSLQRNRIYPQVEAALAIKYFQTAADGLWSPQATAEMKAVYIKDGCLTVAVLSNIYAQEIMLREMELVKIINQKMGKEVVKRIRCLI